MSGNSPQHLGKVLKQLIDSMGVRRGIDEARTVETWAALAGPDVNGVTRRAWVEGRTLCVQLSSAARRHQLHMQRSDLRRRLNEALGADLVQEIRFR